MKKRVVEALLSGEQTSETLSRRMQVTGFGGAALGSHQERKNRSRNLTTWCRLGAMAAVVDSSRPVHEDGAIRRIGRIVRFIERKEDLDHVKVPFNKTGSDQGLAFMTLNRSDPVLRRQGRDGSGGPACEVLIARL